MVLKKPTIFKLTNPKLPKHEGLIVMELHTNILWAYWIFLAYIDRIRCYDPLGTFPMSMTFRKVAMYIIGVNVVLEFD